VENSAVSAVFATRGAVLKSWRLKKYPDSAGQPLELVPHTVPEGTSRPFTLSVGDQPTDSALSSALFKPSADRVDVTSGTSTLTFEYTDASGLAAKKDFVFSADQPYAIDFSSTVSRSGKALQPTVHLVVDDEHAAVLDGPVGEQQLRPHCTNRGVGVDYLELCRKGLGPEGFNSGVIEGIVLRYGSTDRKRLQRPR